MAATGCTIIDLKPDEIQYLYGALSAIDPKIKNRVDYIMNKNKSWKEAEALEFVVTSNPVLWAKVYLDWNARDYQYDIIMEGKKSKKLVLRLGRRLGKCLAGNTLIHDSKTGEYHEIRKLYEKQKNINLFTLDENNFKVVPETTDIIEHNGMNPVHKMITKSGREIIATDYHPFYTLNGFMEMTDLSVGDYVAIAKPGFHSNPVSMDEKEIKLLAYLTKVIFYENRITVKIIGNKEETINDFKETCILNGYEITREYDSLPDSMFDIVPCAETNTSKFRESFTQARKNEIPNCILKLSKEQLSLYLSIAYSLDSWISWSDSNKTFEVGYIASSKRQCVTIQSLLLRYGINAVYQYRIGVADHHTLIIYGCPDSSIFLKEIGIQGYKKEVIGDFLIKMDSYRREIQYPSAFFDILLQEMKDTSPSALQDLRRYSGIRIERKRTLTRDKLLKANELIGSERIKRLLDADIIWDKINKINFIGDKDTYDLTVPNHHNFSANDFITHNTDSMCILILWFAYTQYNKGPNNQYDILIATPYETQIDLIFKRLKQLVDNSPLVSSLVTRDVHHNLVLTVNGIDSNILGLTAGANNSSGGGNSSRGQRADVLILDECDYIGTNQITNILNIRNEAPERIRLICASTPSGKHEEYYKWCMGASRRYSPTKEDIENNTFSDYEITEPDGGNGWTEIYSPSNVNKELLKVNPDTNQTYLEDIRDELSQVRYDQEVMAEFGEEMLGVYQKQFIQKSTDESKRLGYTYITTWEDKLRKEYIRSTENINIRTIGVDWDKYSANTNIVCMEFDRLHQNENGVIEPLFKMLFRIEIPKSEFTYVNAVNKIIELNTIYKPQWIAIDRGYGEQHIAK